MKISIFRPSPIWKWILAGAGWGLLLTATLAKTADTNQPAKSSSDLTDMTLEQLVNVKVTSVAKEQTDLFTSPAAISVVTSDDIRRLGIASLPEALRLVPGMDVAQINANEWAVSTRGFNAEFGRDLLVLLDGRTVYTPGSSGVYWDSQDVVMEDLDRIEIIRGPGATLWGANAVDGVINVISKSAKDTQGLLLSGSAGSVDQDSVTVRYGGELATNLYYRVYAKRSDLSDYIDTSGKSAGDAWNSSMGGFRADWEPPSHNVLTLQGDYYYNETVQSIEQVSLAPPAAYSVRQSEYDQGGNILGRWTRNFSDSGQMTLQTYYDHVEQNTGFGIEYLNTYDIDLQDRFSLGSWNDFVWGTGYRYQAVDDSPTFELTWTPQTQHIRLFNIFGQDDIKVVPDRLHLILGTKLEDNSLIRWEAEPNGRLLWTPTENQTVWAAVSRAARTPSLFELDSRLNAVAFQPPPPSPPALVSIFGDQNNTAEKLLAYEVGYRVAPVKNLSFDVTGFYNVYQNLLIAVPNPTVIETSPSPTHLLISSTYLNAGSGDTYGVELSSQWRVVDNWRLTASYSWLGTRLAPESDYAQSPQQQFQIRSYLDLPCHLELNGAIYLVGRSTGPLATGFDEIPSYVRADLGLIWSPRQWWEVGIWGQNLLQSEHLEFSSQETPALTDVPRSVLGKVTVRF
ncbi:MAG TPA: TonB-dependent receptor [Verrucomicrobiae bacterium]|jgi:iron complex outermembrane receptor protein|nr:TonB-dependent receptor [Verrucomicrobiae bacterium]